jgi:hypothetical protein
MKHAYRRTYFSVYRTEPFRFYFLREGTLCPLNYQYRHMENEYRNVSVDDNLSKSVISVRVTVVKSRTELKIARSVADRMHRRPPAPGTGSVYL